ncbi:hypothetical protein ACLESO_41740 [Pyxidicoccus sp. 3LG]
MKGFAEEAGITANFVGCQGADVGRTKTIDDADILRIAERLFRDKGQAVSTRAVAFVELMPTLLHGAGRRGPGGLGGCAQRGHVRGDERPASP